MIHIHTSEIREAIRKLHAGDTVLLSGKIYTARDAAHSRMSELLSDGKPFPFPIADSVIYYAGPTPAKPGMPIGSCGPTTSSRMDKFTPALLDLGLAAMIGKGDRSHEVIDAMVRNGAVYFCATGGAGALISGCIRSARQIAFPDLGCESIMELTVSDFPLICAIDSRGSNLFETGRSMYAIK